MEGAWGRGWRAAAASYFGAHEYRLSLDTALAKGETDA
jgi:hypothetical protein